MLEFKRPASNARAGSLSARGSMTGACSLKTALSGNLLK
jgi:hypothetical protein